MAILALLLVSGGIVVGSAVWTKREKDPDRMPCAVRCAEHFQ